MATSVLSKEAGLKGKLERCEKRKKRQETIKNNNNNKSNFSPFLEQIAPLSTSFGTLRYQDGDGNWNV